MAKRVVVIPGDDAAPEAMAPTVEILKNFCARHTLHGVSVPVKQE